MSDIYCGVGTVPKKQRIGTPEECVEKGQVRYYGIKQIDKRLLDKTKSKKKDKIPVTRDKLIAEIAKERGNIYRYKGRYEKAPKTLDKKVINEYFKIWKTSEKRYNILVKELKKIEKKNEQLKQSNDTKSSKTKKVSKTKK